MRPKILFFCIELVHPAGSELIMLSSSRFFLEKSRVLIVSVFFWPGERSLEKDGSASAVEHLPETRGGPDAASDHRGAFDAHRPETGH